MFEQFARTEFDRLQSRSEFNATKRLFVVQYHVNHGWIVDHPIVLVWRIEINCGTRYFVEAMKEMNWRRKEELGCLDCFDILFCNVSLRSLLSVRLTVGLIYL